MGSKLQICVPLEMYNILDICVCVCVCACVCVSATSHVPPCPTGTHPDVDDGPKLLEVSTELGHSVLLRRKVAHYQTVSRHSLWTLHTPGGMAMENRHS